MRAHRALLCLLLATGCVHRSMNPGDTAPVQGRVVDSGGNPLGQAVVTVTRMHWLFGAGSECTATTRDDGRFECNPGTLQFEERTRYRLTVQKTGFSVDPQNFQYSARQSAPEIHLADLYTVTFERRTRIEEPVPDFVPRSGGVMY